MIQAADYNKHSKDLRKYLNMIKYGNYSKRL